jgi:hypothetical protein
MVQRARPERHDELDWLEPIPKDSIPLASLETWCREKCELGKHLRFITVEEITPEIIGSLKEGAPYTQPGTQSQRKYANLFSVSRTEQFVDHCAIPDFVQFTDIEIPVDPYAENRAIPIAQRTTRENIILDNTEDRID